VPAGIFCYILLLLTPLSSGAGFIYKNLEVHLAHSEHLSLRSKKHFDSYIFQLVWPLFLLFSSHPFNLLAYLFNAVLGKPFFSPNRRLLLLFLHGAV
jgi:hypothetical protein